MSTSSTSSTSSRTRRPRPIAPFAAGLVLLAMLTGCSSDFEVHIGVPEARDYRESVPLRVADVQIGETGATSLGPDGLPMVVAHIRDEFRRHITDDTVFVLRRERFGLGPRYIEVLPGEGERVGAGHHFVARAGSVSAQANQWWKDLVRQTQDVDVQARLQALRDDVEAALQSSREQWDEMRPELEAEMRELARDLGEESQRAADDLQRWFEETMGEGGERPTPPAQ